MNRDTVAFLVPIVLVLGLLGSALLYRWKSEGDGTASREAYSRQSAASVLEHADHLRRRGRYDQAIKLLEPHVAHTPEASAFLSLGLTYYELYEQEILGGQNPDRIRELHRSAKSALRQAADLSGTTQREVRDAASLRLRGLPDEGLLDLVLAEMGGSSQDVVDWRAPGSPAPMPGALGAFLRGMGYKRQLREALRQGAPAERVEELRAVASEAYREVLESADPEDPLATKALRYLEHLEDRSGADFRQREAFDHFRRAEEAYDEGRYRDAIRGYRQAAEFDPRIPSYRLYLGDAYFALGQSTEALEQYRETLVLEPGNPTAWHFLGDALLTLGAPSEALKAYRWALTLDPSYPTPRSKIEHVESMPPSTGGFPAELRFEVICADLLARWEADFGPFTEFLLAGRMPPTGDEDFAEAHWISSLPKPSDAAFSSGVQAAFDPRSGMVLLSEDTFFDPDRLAEDLAVVDHELTHLMKHQGLLERDIPLAAASGYLRWWQLASALRDPKHRLDDSVLSLIDRGRSFPAEDPELERHVDRMLEYFEKFEVETDESYAVGALLVGISLELAAEESETAQRYLVGLSHGMSHEQAVAEMGRPAP